MKVVPMGWTWALYICQKVHERAVHYVGLSDEVRVVDGEVAPSLESGAHTEYVDNFAALALEPERANSWMRSVKRRLIQLGLPVHDVEDATTDVRLLGWHLDGWLALLRLRGRGRGSCGSGYCRCVYKGWPLVATLRGWSAMRRSSRFCAAKLFLCSRRFTLLLVLDTT